MKKEFMSPKHIFGKKREVVFENNVSKIFGKKFETPKESVQDAEPVQEKKVRKPRTKKVEVNENEYSTEG